MLSNNKAHTFKKLILENEELSGFCKKKTNKELKVLMKFSIFNTIINISHCFNYILIFRIL